MSREKTFLYALVVLVASGLIFGTLRGGSIQIQRSWLIEPAPQPTLERSWSSMEFAERPFGAANSGWQLIKGEAVAGTPGGALLVLDWGRPAVHQLDFDGGSRVSFLGPATLVEDLFPPPIDFAVGASGEVAAVFSRDPSVHFFAAGGEPLSVLPLEGDPLRVAVTTEDRLVVMTATGEDLFEIFDREGRLLKRFGRLIEGEYQDRVLLDGDLAADGMGGFVYAPYYLGLIASYTGEGELRFLVRTVPEGPRELPLIIVGDDGSRRILPGTPRSCLTVHVDGGRIYRLSERETRASRRRILDAYRSSDGLYLESIRLPNGPRDAFLVGDLLYTVHEQRVREWQLTKRSTAVADVVPAGQWPRGAN